MNTGAEIITAWVVRKCSAPIIAIVFSSKQDIFQGQNKAKRAQIGIGQKENILNLVGRYHIKPTLDGANAVIAGISAVLENKSIEIAILDFALKCFILTCKSSSDEEGQDEELGNHVEVLFSRCFVGK